MRKVAIVGNIASGKSEVKNILLSMGYKVLDTDTVSHSLLQNDIEIKQTFKDYDVFENSEISRKKLGELVFSNQNLLANLESILHPKVKIAILDFFNVNKNEDTLFVEIPLLFEAGMQDLFDDILFVYASDDVRKKRLINRNGFSDEYAQKRMDSQLPQEDKIKQATIVINNENSIEDLKNQLSKLFMQ